MEKAIAKVSRQEDSILPLDLSLLHCMALGETGCRWKYRVHLNYELRTSPSSSGIRTLNLLRRPVDGQLCKINAYKRPHVLSCPEKQSDIEWRVRLVPPSVDLGVQANTS